MNPATHLYLYKPTFSLIKKFTFLRKVILITFNNRNIVKNIVIIPCLAFLLIMGSFKPAGLALYKVDRVVIDAGHGGKDPGTHGLISQEKIIALKIAKELGRIIEENLKDVEVIYTRTTDEFIELEDRAMIANKNDADVFIVPKDNYEEAVRCNKKLHIIPVENFDEVIIKLIKLSL